MNRLASPNYGRALRSTIVIVAVAAAAVIALSFMTLRAKPVDAVTVAKAPIKQTLVFSARVSSVARSDIASTITARVDKILAREGDLVKAGQLLVALDDAEISAQLKQADAALDVAQARLRAQREVSGPLANEALRAATSNHEFASRELARNRTLFERGFIGQARLQEAERALITAQSALDQARAQQSGNAQSGAETVTAAARVREATAARALTAAKLSQTRIVAPGNAKVVARNIELGEIAQPGRRLLALAPEGETRLVAQIDEKNLALLR